MRSLASLGYGSVARLRRDPTEARRRFSDALEVTGRAGMVAESVTALTGLAAAHMDSGDLQDADATLARAAEAVRTVGEPGVRAGVLEQRARLAVAHGHLADAAALLAEASSLRDGAVRPRTALESRDVHEVAVTLRTDAATDETAGPTTGASQGNPAPTGQ